MSDTTTLDAALSTLDALADLHDALDELLAMMDAVTVERVMKRAGVLEDERDGALAMPEAGT